MKPSRQFRPSLHGTDQLEERIVLNAQHPFYHQRIPVFQPAQTQVLPTPTIPRITPSAIRTYELVPPPGQVNPTGSISLAYQVTGASIVPFGYTYSNAQPGTALVSVAGVPSGGTGPKSQIIDVGTLGQRQSFYQTAATEMITTNPALFRAGFVTVGVTPTTYDATTKVTSSTAGELRVLNVVGSPVMILRDPTLINGATGLAWIDKGNAGSLFVSNSINGVVSRFDFKIYQRGIPAIKLIRATQIGGGYTTAGAATTSLQGPAGMSYDQTTDTLYVASSLDNKVYAIDRASRVANSATQGRVVVSSAQVTAPTGVSLSPSRTLLVAGDLANGMTGLAEFSTRGGFITTLSTGTLPAGSGSVTWQPSLYGFGPEVVQVNANDNTIQFLPIIQN